MLQVTDAQGPRFQLTLERLKDGHPFALGGVYFWISPDSHLQISVDSSWERENLTHDRALADLDRARHIYKTLCAESAEFAAVVQPHSPLFVLLYKDGTGSIELARLIEGNLIWGSGLQTLRQ